MPKYSYTAVDLENKSVKSQAEARDENDLRRMLRGRNLVLINCREIEEKFARYRLKSNEIGEFSRQLASMLGSGITVLRALEILKNRDFKRELISVYTRLHRDVQQGYTLSEALKLQPHSFPELFINMYASAEASGQLEQVADKMAVHYNKEHKLNSMVKTAMMYPIILAFVTVAVVMIIFTVVLPTFFELFADVELPTITRAVIAISEFLQKNWYWAILGMILLVFCTRIVLRLESVRLVTDKLKLKLPVAGKLLKTIYTARFARTLSSLYTSGVPMIRALEITSTVLNNKYIENQFEGVAKNVRNGEPLSESVGAVNGFDTKLAASILIGEESGRLDALLDATADGFDYEAEVATARLVQLVQPVMIIIMAVIIGFIMLSVLTPLMSIYQNIGS